MGKFTIGGFKRRIVIIGLNSEMHYNGLFGEARRRMLELVSAQGVQ